MKKYKVKLIFLYSDTLHIEAEDEEGAETKALDICQEKYECYYDSEIIEEE